MANPGRTPTASVRSVAAGTALIAIAGLAIVNERTFDKPAAATTIGVALVLMAIAAFYGLRLGLELPRNPIARAALLVEGALIMLLSAHEVALRGGRRYELIVAVLGVVLLWLTVRRRSWGKDRLVASLVVAATVVAVIGVAVLVATPPPIIDVIEVNHAGATALAEGENPYVSIDVVNTNPFSAEGTRFEGYVYPPLALVLNSVSDRVLGDYRWINVIAVAILVMLVAGFRSWGDYPPPITGAVAFAVAFLPTLPFVLRQGWTDPLALPFLAGAVLLWRSRPTSSAVLLGLALATKQYYVMLAPLILFWDDEFRFRRLAVSGGVILATFLPFLVLDARALWDAAIGPLLNMSIRPDSTNVIALGFVPPSWLTPAAAGIAGVILGRRGGNGPAFAMASAVVLGLGFFFGRQAFANYWFVIYALAVIAVAAASRRLDLPDHVAGQPARIDAAAAESS